MTSDKTRKGALYTYTFGLLRKIYDWVLSWAHKKHSSKALFILAFAESSFFPVPPDVLQISLSVSRPKKSFFYAFISSVGSILGGIFGYFIGLKLWWVLKDFFFTYIPGFTPEIFNVIQTKYELYNFGIVFAAGFTPIPYKIITISAGLFGISFLMFIIASAVSRSARFFLVATLIYFFGPKMKEFIDKYFNLLTIIFIALFIGGFVAIKYLL
ncbi:cytochrome B [Candidatus Woesearchaeota archaeon]|jgi:membrane protein YqaA with SNARE-associated domain|nr:cytochrome B [Candidatus Woesearchaeota archaeon]|tara:strand:+ start:2100 stop:2738 length:639 start_codon:yes stop_codon:yes gene_type:complete